MSTVSVTSKGQITIPLNLRRQLGLQHGSRVELVVVNDHLEMHLPVSQGSTGAMTGSGFGLLKSTAPAVPADFDAATLARAAGATRKAAHRR